MNVNVNLHVDNEDDVDDTDDTGLTEDAYNRLMEALSSAGFSIQDGVTKEDAS